MDWLKQSEDMIKMWSETQQKMMSGWLGSMKNFSQPQSTGVWEKTLDAWENAVQNLLETQAQWVRMWAGSITATKGTSQETMQGAAQVKEITEQWVAFQQDLWKNWFEMVRKLDLSTLAEQTPESVFEAWQGSLKKAMDAQQEWLQSWTAAQKPGK